MIARATTSPSGVPQPSRRPSIEAPKARSTVIRWQVARPNVQSDPGTGMSTSPTSPTSSTARSATRRIEARAPESSIGSTGSGTVHWVPAVPPTRFLPPRPAGSMAQKALRVPQFFSS